MRTGFLCFFRVLRAFTRLRESVYTTALSSFNTLICSMAANIAYASAVKMLVLGCRTPAAVKDRPTAAYDTVFSDFEASVKNSGQVYLCWSSRKYVRICAIGACFVTSMKDVSQSIACHCHGGSRAAGAIRQFSRSGTPASLDKSLTRSEKGGLTEGRLSKSAELDKSLTVECEGWSLFACTFRKYVNDM